MLRIWAGDPSGKRIPTRGRALTPGRDASAGPAWEEWSETSRSSVLEAQGLQQESAAEPLEALVGTRGHYKVFSSMEERAGSLKTNAISRVGFETQPHQIRHGGGDSHRKLLLLDQEQAALQSRVLPRPTKRAGAVVHDNL